MADDEEIVVHIEDDTAAPPGGDKPRNADGTFAKAAPDDPAEDLAAQLEEQRQATERERGEAAAEAKSPNISAQASPEKIGSIMIGTAPSIAALAVRSIGRSLTTQLSMIASDRVLPLESDACMKSTRIMEFLVTMPESAIIPIMPVAVKYIGFRYPLIECAPSRFSNQNPGITPNTVKGIAAIITAGMVKEDV